MNAGGAGSQAIIIVSPGPGRVQRTLDTCWRGDKESKAITVQ